MACPLPGDSAGARDISPSSRHDTRVVARWKTGRRRPSPQLLLLLQAFVSRWQTAESLPMTACRNKSKKRNRLLAPPSFGGVAVANSTKTTREHENAPSSYAPRSRSSARSRSRSCASASSSFRPQPGAGQPSARRAAAAEATAAFARLHSFARTLCYPLKRQPVSLFGSNRASRVGVQRRWWRRFSLFSFARLPLLPCPDRRARPSGRL